MASTLGWRPSHHLGILAKLVAYGHGPSAPPEQRFARHAALLAGAEELPSPKPL